MQEVLNEHCWWAGPSLEGMSQAGARWFSDYADDSPVISKAKIECDRIYAANRERRDSEKAKMAVDNENRKTKQQAEKAQVLRAQGFNVARFFESSGISNTVIVETTARRRLKCAAYDGSGTPLAVQHAIVTPPVDEVVLIMRNPNLAQRVRCWSL